MAIIYGGGKDGPGKDDVFSVAASGVKLADTLVQTIQV